ncbi:hypothetical protein CIHG_09730 [Coccidioides immitis H538.4]|uniref:Altered inheritance of mitochondria protein 9, mitochondrial n=1 Tax=Coccidioides immitis H538.4 TaxID=396776 RepID=A0A0J8UVI2_COCIT|nr:hypothetical protein CIHG_09730 [Coccidioides immitis H538.4]
MDFARNKLDLSVPKVLVWNSHASENPVGAEYIIMKKAADSSLAHIWLCLSNKEKRDIIRAMVSFNVKILNHLLGSISFLEELFLNWSSYHILLSEVCQTSILWHKNLHLDNIFMNSEKPTEIIGLIDWQNVHVLSLFNQVMHPAFLNYKELKLEGLKILSLLENFEELDEIAKKHAKKLLVEQTLYKYYNLYSASINVLAYHALRYQKTLQEEIVTLISMLLNNGEPPLQELLMKLASKWNQLISSKKDPPCPLQYSAEAIDCQQELEVKWVEGIVLMDDVLESLGGTICGWDGWVSHEDYEALKQKLDLVRKQFIEHFAGDDREAAKAWAQAWPFNEMLLDAADADLGYSRAGHGGYSCS